MGEGVGEVVGRYGLFVALIFMFNDKNINGNVRMGRLD